jgi:hypothetical protein
MENLHVWLLILTGGSIGVLGIFLFAAELRNKHRERLKLRSDQSDKTIIGTTAHQPGKHSPADLMTRNKELIEKISSLSKQLEESRRTVDELKIEPDRLPRFQADSPQAHEELMNLREQLQQTQSRFKEATLRQQQLADLNAKLQADALELKQQLRAGDERVTALKTDLENLKADQAEYRKLCAENQQLQAAKRALEQEIPNLQIQLQASQTRLSDAIDQAQEVAARNARLETQVAELKQQLQASHSNLEGIQNEQQRLADMTLENEQLRNQLQQSEARLAEAAKENQEAAAHYARLQQEIANLQEEVAEGQSNARAVAALEQQLTDVQARETMLTERQHRLEASIAQLEREQAKATQTDQELESAHERLYEMEQLCRELHDENRRLEEETSGLQGALVAGPRPLMNAASRLAHTSSPPALQNTTDASVETTVASIDSSIGDQLQQPKATLPINESNESHPHHTNLALAASAGAIQSVNEANLKQPARSFGKRSWYFGIVPAVVVLAIAVGFAVGLFEMGSDTFSGSEQVALEPDSAFDEPAPSTDAASQKSKRSGRPSITPAPENERSRQTAAPRLRGTFKTTRPTEIYSGPSENSALIASVGPGMKINVVSSRDGWLEIRSKHGRPPGFIRQEAAERMEQLN